MSAIKRIGIGFVAILLLLGLAAGSIWGVASARLKQSYSFPAGNLSLSTEEATLAEGQYIFETTGCTSCHGSDLGGEVLAEDPALGLIYAPNLTAGEGGIGAQYSDEDWEAALRHGVNAQGRPLLVMPSQHYTHFSDEDLSALVSYVKSLPPVDRATPARRLGPLAAALITFGQFPIPAEVIDHEAEREPIEAAASADYGGYLISSRGCADCHGATLQGATVPGSEVIAPDITGSGAPGQWSEAEFFTAIRNGIRPDGSLIDPEEMPWPYYARFSDEDLQALYLYLHDLR